MGNPIFISYKRVDKERVFVIKEYIESNTGLSCWIDLDGIESDAIFKNVIIKAINACNIMLFMYSKAHSDITDYDKDWTVKELSFASKKKKRIVFVNIDGSELSDIFEFDYGTQQQVDANDPSRLEKLVIDIKRWLKITDSVTNSIESEKTDCEIKKEYHELGVKKKTEKENITSQKNETLFQKGYNLYYGTDGIERNVEKAFPYFQQAAKMNHRKAQEYLAKYYLWGMVVKSDKEQAEYWLLQSKLPEEPLKPGIATISTEGLPKSLSFEYQEQKLYMVLSEDEQFYLGNLNAKEGDWSWCNNKWIQTMGAGAICAGAVAFGIVALPIAIILALKALSSIFSDNDTKEIVVDSKLCNQLSDSTGYRFSVPYDNELKGVNKEMQSGCIVLRVCNNAKLFAQTQNR